MITRSALIAMAVSLAGGVAAAQTPASQAPRTLSLQEALEIAERESEAVGIARAEVSRALGQRRRARSGYFPQLSGSASYTRTLRSQFSALQGDGGDEPAGPPPEECPSFVPRPGLPVEERLDSLEAAVECASNADPFSAFRDLPFGQENTYRFGLSFSQALFTGGRLRGQTRAADAGVRGAELGLTAARAQLLLEVTQSYYDAALGDRLVQIAEETLQLADTTLSQTRLAHQVGNQSEFDLLRARVTRDNQRPIVIQRRAERDLAYFRLRQVLDLPAEQPLVLTTELGDTAPAPVPGLVELVAAPGDTAAAVRVPVRQAEEGVTSREGLLGVARAQRLPQVSLTSDYAEIAYPSDGLPVGTNYFSDWTVAVGLQLPIFTGGRIRGEVDAAKAELEQARLRLRQTRELAQLDARDAALQLDAALAAWEASAGTEEQAARAYQIAEIRYREGISTQTELNEQRIQLAQAQVNRARAARDLLVARTRLALLPALPLGGAPAATPATAAGAAPQGTTSETQPYQAPRTQQSLTGGLTGTTQTGAAVQ